jgi:pilus assembly protein CpaC
VPVPLVAAAPIPAPPMPAPAIAAQPVSVPLATPAPARQRPAAVRPAADRPATEGPEADHPATERRNGRAGRDGVVAPRDPTIALELGKGTLVSLRRPAATVFVANPDTADVQVKSPTLIYVFAKAPGETVLYAVDEHEQPLYSSTVVVTANLSRLRAGLRQLMPEEPVEATALDGAIVLSGTVSSAARAEDARGLAQVFAQQSKLSTVINRLSVAAPSQVNLRVRIVEIGRNTLKELGINWNSLLQSSRFAFGLVTNNPVTQPDNLFRNTATAAWREGRNNVDAIIDALGQEGLVTVLAEPNLTALSGQTASFLAGGEFPIPVPTEGAQTTITIVFKKFGVALDFTPTILDGRRINLHVRPEVSQLTDAGAVAFQDITVPALTVRRAETTVELGSGESFAIAGLLENDTKLDISKIPGLGDMPVLGQLFRSDRFKRNETELAILVTPYLVRPAPAAAIAGPTDPAIPGTAGMAQAGARPAGSAGLIGPAGFTLD